MLVEEQPNKWRVATDPSNGRAPGVTCRRSKKMGDIIENRVVHWNSLIDGVDDGDGWVRCKLEARSHVLPLACIKWSVSTSVALLNSF